VSGSRHAPSPGRSARRTPAPHRHETSAGGIIYRKRNGAVEIFFIKDSYGRWTFPKGHQELGESLAETAVREIQEETGLDGLRLVGPLGKTSFRFRREVGVILKSVHYFLFEARPDAKERFQSRAEVGEGKELIQEGRWVPMRQAFSVSSYKNSDHLLASAFRLLAHGAPQGVAGVARSKNRRRARRRRWHHNNAPRSGRSDTRARPPAA
jgi:8-oxo-dGTP pyrophosphatase MutT (NUDIX family)